MFKDNYKTKKQIEQELNETNSLNLYYRAKLDKMQAILRKQKETNGNPYTMIRELNDVMTYYNKEDFDEERL